MQSSLHTGSNKGNTDDEAPPLAPPAVGFGGCRCCQMERSQLIPAFATIDQRVVSSASGSEQWADRPGYDSQRLGEGPGVHAATCGMALDLEIKPGRTTAAGRGQVVHARKIGENEPHLAIDERQQPRRLFVAIWGPNSGGWLVASAAGVAAAAKDVRSMDAPGMSADCSQEWSRSGDCVESLSRKSRPWELPRKLPNFTRVVDLLAEYHRPMPVDCNAVRWPQAAACVKEAWRVSVSC